MKKMQRASILKTSAIFTALLLTVAFTMLLFAGCGSTGAVKDETTAGVSDTTAENTTAADTTSDENTTADDTTADNETSDAEIPTEKTSVKVIALKGPTGMGMSKLMKDNDDKTTANDYSFTLASAPDEVTSEIIKGNADIAAIPTNLASVLFNKTSGEISVIALNTRGVLYMLENGDTINSVEDLRGKTIYATGQASTPEYILRYILEKNGIDPDTDVTIEYKADHSELATLMGSGDVVIGMLPEPNVTVAMNANPDLRIALNLTEEWDKIAGSESGLVMGCIVVRNEFANANPDAVSAFLTEYSASVEYVNSNYDEASELIENYGIVAKAALAKKALPNCNICCITGNEMQNTLSGFLNVLFEANPASVGGAIPDDSFYYVK